MPSYVYAESARSSKPAFDNQDSLAINECISKLKAKKGKVVFDGKAPNRKDLSGPALKIYDAIMGKKDVHIALTHNDGAVDFGSPYSLDSSGNVSTAKQTIDFGDIDKANAAKLPDFNEKSIVGHETIEAISIQIDGAASFEDAHNAANAAFPGIAPTHPGSVPDATGIGAAEREYQVQAPGGSIFYFELTLRGTPSGPPPSLSLGDILTWRTSNPIDVTWVHK